MRSEGLVNFAIDLYLGTYACLIVSAVDGTVDVATNTTEKLISLVNDTVSSVANELDTGLNDISKIINKVIKAASKVENFFTGDDDDSNMTSSIKSVNLTISALHNLYIPSSINDKLEELSAKTPDFAQVKNTTKNLISVPLQ
ncbi:CFF_collapsed_G0045470.mRNA.1.CDS.1 [Saccharomyces cerevisiae]|nr:CFF_collapsed_G0045470.mRNA.1.CDS.1 [Saccharomyces cerevisiae]